ncbi:MAG: superoxide dismutase [Bdellovibrionota bacterium]
MVQYQLPKLPYAFNQFTGFLSPETFEFHYGKHHQKYIDNLNHLLPGTGLEELSLNEIIMLADGEVFNNAAQTWNHAFFWYSMIPETFKPQTGSDFLEAVKRNFQSMENLEDRFMATAMKHFGSGYTWLIKDRSGTLQFVSTANADVPFKTKECVPLMTCDLWEHAYYIDHRNNKEEYLKGFWDHINWYFVERNFHLHKPVDLTIAFKPHHAQAGHAMNDLIQPSH